MESGYRPESPLQKHAWPFALALVLFAVLPPEPAWVGPGPRFLFDLLAASPSAIFDALGNVCLYVPLGIAVAARGVSRHRTIAAAFVLSATTELLQVIIPGRDPSMGDVLANTIGAWLGTILFSPRRTQAPRAWFRAIDRRISGLVDPDDHRAGLLAFAWAALVASIFVGSARLLVPAPMSAPYLVGSPDVDISDEPGSVAGPPHHVTDFSINGAALVPGLLRDAPVVEKALRGSLSFRGTLVCGELTGAVAPMFVLKGLWNTDMFTLSAAGNDLLVSYATWPRRLHMRSPPARVRDAISACTSGRKLPLEVSGPLQRPRVRIGGRLLHGTTPGIASAWAFVVHSELLPVVIGTSASLVWLAALVIPFGFWARLDAWTCAGTVLIAIGAWIVPLLFAAWTDLPQSVAIVGGAAAGVLFHVRRRHAITFRAATAPSESS